MYDIFIIDVFRYIWLRTNSYRTGSYENKQQIRNEYELAFEGMEK